MTQQTGGAMPSAGRGPTTTERDAGTAFQVLANASDDPEVLAVLTDEEILAVDGVETEQVTDMPFTDQESVDSAVYAAAATRALIARGLLLTQPEQPEGEPLEGPAGERSLQLDPTIAGLTTLRRSPVAMLSAHRQVADQLTALFEYAFPAEGMLEELVTADGFHHFSVPTAGAVAGRLVRYIDPDQVASGSTELFRGPMEGLDGRAELTASLDDARAITILTGVDGPRRFQHTLFTTSDGVIDLDTGGGVATEQEVTLREVDPAGLRSLIQDLLPVRS